MNAPLLPALPGYTNPELIAHGTSALVFRATQTTLNRLVAIKVITVDTGSVPVNAARELATTVALSSQPHIVSIIDTGVTDDDRPYIVMEYCEGGSYAAILRQYGPLPLPDVLEVGVKIGEALHAAHQAGIVHRDVKPSNILRSRFGPALTDFGIARAPDELGSTLTRELMTPHHASPEALLHQAQSGISDVYSLASTIWTLLVGHPPFVDPLQPAMDMYAFRDRVLHDELPAMPRADVPAWLVAELRRAMSKLPSERHRSALEFAESLRRGSLGLAPSGAAGTAPAPADPVLPGPAPDPAGPEPARPGGPLSSTGSSRLAAANAAGVLPPVATSAYGQPATFVPPAPRGTPESTLDRAEPAPAATEPAATEPAPTEPAASTPTIATYVSPWTTTPNPPSEPGPATDGATGDPTATDRATGTGGGTGIGIGTGDSTGGGTGGRRSAGASRPPVIPPLPATAPAPAPWTLAVGPPAAQTPVPTAQTPVPTAQTPVPTAQTPVPTAQTPVPTAQTPVAIDPIPSAPPLGPIPLPPLPPEPPLPPAPVQPPPPLQPPGPLQPGAYPPPAASPPGRPGSWSGPAVTAAALADPAPPSAPARPAPAAPSGPPYPTYPTRRLDQPIVAPPPNRRGVLIGVLVVLAVVAIAAGAIVVLLAKDRAAPVAQGPSQTPTLDQPSASPQGTKFLTPGTVGAPTNVRLLDLHTTSITVSWDDPTSGTVEFLVLATGPNNERLDPKAVPRGATTATFNQLSPTKNYCFVVVAVYSGDRVPRTDPVCTKR